MTSPPRTVDDMRTVFVKHLMDDIDECVEDVESPIEKLLLWGLILEWRESAMGSQWKAFPVCGIGQLPGGTGGEVWGLWLGGEREGSQIDILLQPNIEAGGSFYRLDFAIRARRWAFPVRGSPAVQARFVLHDEVFVAVECDGHDFHEKTKEQAKRDKKRDRDLQAIGWSVARFTGSEIFKDPCASAAQVLRLVESLQALAHRGGRP